MNGDGSITARDKKMIYKPYRWDDAALVKNSTWRRMDMKKKWLAFGLAVMLGLSGNVSTVSYAAETVNAEQATIVPYEGAAYELHYSAEGDTVTITGIECEDKTQGLGKLVIPPEINGKTVTGIGDWAFYCCSGFTGELLIPEGVTSIGEFAFSGCSGFTGDLIIPKGVTDIGSDAFMQCRGFTGSLILPESLTDIGRNAFWMCEGLTGELKMPENLTMIKKGAFGYCNFTGKLVIPEGVTAIGEEAFYECSGFTGELVLPGGITEIGREAFKNCNGFTGKLVLPEHITVIGEYAFGGCSGFSGEFILPDGLVTIGRGAFAGCSGITGELRMPESATSVGEGAFCGCIGLEGVEEKRIMGTVISCGDVNEKVHIELAIGDGAWAVPISEMEMEGNNVSYEIGTLAKGVTYILEARKEGCATRWYEGITIEDDFARQDIELYLIGDINGDGAVTARDKKVLYNHIAGISLLTGYEFNVGDVNGDWEITARDKKMIYNHIAGTTLLW